MHWFQHHNILFGKNATNVIPTIKTHFYVGGLQVAEMKGSAVYYVHGDHLGSVKMVMSSSGQISFTANYVPYGTKYASTGSEVFTYTDKPYDSMTGLYYFGARFYDPTVGRFITEDCNSGFTDDPLSLNLYAYARDNPMKIIDRTGHDWLSSLNTLIAEIDKSIASAITDSGSAVRSIARPSTLNPIRSLVFSRLPFVKLVMVAFLQKFITQDTGLSRLKTHRVVATLPERGIVHVERRGNTNEVSLVRWFLDGIG